jgi:hypothetical protein
LCGAARTIFAAGARPEADRGLGVEPLRPTVETANAAPIAPIVAILMRRGVSHVA